jgi:hypothetical protein
MVKGTTFYVPTLGYTKRVNCFVSLFWPQKRIVWNCFPRRRNIEFRKHLYNLVAHAKRHRLKRIILFVDKASYHRTPQVRRYIKQHPVLRTKYLPKKDPNASPTECLVNKRLSAAVSVNRCHPDINALGSAAKKFLRRYNSVYAT